jgi:hypothetical protein
VQELRMPITRFLPTAALAMATLGFAQSTPPPAPLPMLASRTLASYQIYSGLMPLGETADKGWPHALWLIRDTTITAIPDDQPCSPGPAVNARESAPGNNPHLVVTPTAVYAQDFREILQDFDEHCHDHIALDQSAFHTAVPIRLLSAAEQQEFRDVRNAGPGASADASAKFAGAPALYAFSEVYFNRNQTVALVWVTHWCGSQCGQGFWRALALDHGQWKVLDSWRAPQWIS